MNKKRRIFDIIGGNSSTPTFEGATVIYSLRQIITSATKCIRVRRCNDNAEQDIGYVNGFLDTTSLMSFVGSASGFVTKWYDQIGGLDISQVTTAKQPKIVVAGVLQLSN